MEPFPLAGQQSYVATSAGIAIFPSDGADYQTLLKNAGAAMYAAKREATSSFRFYEPDLRRTVARKLALDKGLSWALANQEFVLEYEAQIDVVSGQVIGAEALIRWIHPQHGLTSPKAFMPLAEKMGQVVEIGAWVLEQTCR